MTYIKLATTKTTRGRQRKFTLQALYGIRGNGSPLMDVIGYGRLWAVLRGNGGLWVDVICYGRLWVVVRGNGRLWVVVRGNGRLWVNVGANGWP